MKKTIALGCHFIGKRNNPLPCPTFLPAVIALFSVHGVKNKVAQSEPPKVSSKLG